MIGLKCRYLVCDSISPHVYDAEAPGAQLGLHHPVPHSHCDGGPPLKKKQCFVTGIFNAHFRGFLEIIFPRFPNESKFYILHEIELSDHIYHNITLRFIVCYFVFFHRNLDIFLIKIVFGMLLLYLHSFLLKYPLLQFSLKIANQNNITLFGITVEQ